MGHFCIVEGVCVEQLVSRIYVNISTRCLCSDSIVSDI